MSRSLDQLNSQEFSCSWHVSLNSGEFSYGQPAMARKKSRHLAAV